MARCGYGAQTGAAVALTAATAKSILGIRAGAAFGLDLVYYVVSFDGVTASAVSVLVELCRATFATNAPGTNSTTVTPVQNYGRSLAHGMSAARAWTAEPTVVTVLDEFLLDPNKGTLKEWEPMGREFDCGFDEGFVIRCNAPAAVNVRAAFDVERI